MMKRLKATYLMTGIFAGGLVLGSMADPGVVCRVETDRAVYFSGRAQKAIVKVTLDAPMAPRVDERPPVNLTIVLDRSGSMSGQKLEKACEAAIAALRRLGAKDLFSLVTYHSGVETVVPAQSAANSEWIEGRIRSIKTGGNTALFAGMSQGASEVRKNLEGNYIHRMLLLSDGLANSGPSSPTELGRLGSALMKEGISVTTIGVGTDYNEDLMTMLAQRSDGNTYFVESSRDLPRIFSAELGDVLSVVASTVEVEIIFPEGVTPLRFIGREGRIGHQRAELSLNQLYGGQEKYALIEVQLPEGFKGETRQIAEAHCRYENRISNRAASSTAIARVSYSERETDVEASVNSPVIKAQVINVMAEVNEQAIQMADQQQFKDASELMLSNSVWAKETAEKYDLKELEPVYNNMRNDAAEISSSGSLPNAKRKLMKSSSFGWFRQQKTAPVASDEKRASKK